LIYESTYFHNKKEVVKIQRNPSENTPSGMVLAGEIGITNQAAKRMGTIGVRLIDDDLSAPPEKRCLQRTLLEG
jgi:UPF0288 family protein (methanogenesis marker protein 3)